jgi:formate hydrogenlyase transcriptional activator
MKASGSRRNDESAASEDAVRRAADTTPAFIHTARPDGYLDYFNRGWLDFFGKSLEEVCGWRWTESIHPDDVDGIVQRWRAALASGEPFEAEARVRCANGTYHAFLHRKVPLRDEHGEIVKWFGSSIEIEDRRRAEEQFRRSNEELQRSESYLEEGQRLAHMGSWAFDAAGFDYWSPELFRIYGLEPTSSAPTVEEYLNCIHPDDREFMASLIKRVLAEPSPFDATKRIVRPDGQVRYIRCVGAPVVENHKLKKYVGSALDVTEQEELAKELRKGEAELRQTLDFAPQLIGVFGPRHERFYANRTALEYVGVSLDEWRERSFGSDMHPDDTGPLQSLVERSLPDGLPYELELRLRAGDGSYRWFLARYNPVRDDEGQIIRWYVACTDIDDRKRAEERLQQENVALREEVDKASMFEEIVGASPQLTAVLSRVSKVAPTDSTVLIMGETGTGKELIARALHKGSRRSERSFVNVNCGAIPPSLIMSELFGHEKGAFTGAVQRRLGKFELAEGGTIFLDEVGDLPPETQVALLRVLQEREFERVGGTEVLCADVRVIAATNRDLQKAIADGAFRTDLYYRLNVFPITLPPLRERKEDVPLLVGYFVERYAKRAGKKIKHIQKNSLEAMREYAWPGNVRELQNVIERSLIISETNELSIDKSWLTNEPQRLTAGAARKSNERKRIEEALEQSYGKVSGADGAAVRLGMPASTLESKIRALRINKLEFKGI